MPVCKLCVNSLKLFIIIQPIPVCPNDIPGMFFEELVTMQRYFFKDSLDSSLGQARYIFFLVVLEKLGHLSRHIGV